MEKAFISRNGSNALEEIINSPNKFSQKEWIRFFGCLRDISIFFVRSSGSLRYFTFVLPCFQTMTARVSSASFKFEILIDLLFALYKFACEIKYLYGFDHSDVQNFYEVQEILQTIITEQNYKECDWKIFNDLNSLVYAAFHNGIGRPELSKQKLKRFFEGLDETIDCSSLLGIQFIIVGLHFYHMAIALEEDTDNPVDKKIIIDYLNYSHYLIGPIALFKREFDFPFYNQILLGKFCFTFIFSNLLIL